MDTRIAANMYELELCDLEQVVGSGAYNWNVPKYAPLFGTIGYVYAYGYTMGYVQNS